MAKPRVLTEGSKHAIATARAKAQGLRDFSPGSAGAKKRKEIAEAIAAKTKIVPGPGRTERMRDAAKRALRRKR